ncbi:MAG: flagellar export protein FliJ [Clostridiaceae bacterium]|nr:flagellar export protein FliJ [Clostridiaceae bacterium]MBW4858735.1 flagellar export protein FliJ [Clostridiaceae bacterium]MBW4868194.1 flagellar export protein FliJ [Clostridiaceae bacterium]
MEKFNFKFEKILDYKKTIESHKKNEYGKIQQKLTKEEKILENYYEFKDKLKNKKDQSNKKTNIANLQLYNNYLNDMNKLISAQEGIIDQTKKELKVAKNELLEVSKEKKIFEKLKENKYEEHLYDIKKEEEKLIDTIVSFKASTH